MKLSIPVVETIQKRQSVRTYEERTLSVQDREALLDCVKQLNNPFWVFPSRIRNWLPLLPDMNLKT